jgi:hypothetical protein
MRLILTVDHLSAVAEAAMRSFLFCPELCYMYVSFHRCSIDMHSYLFLAFGMYLVYTNSVSRYC